VTEISFQNGDNFIRNAVTISTYGTAACAALHLRRLSWSDDLPVSLEAVALDLRVDAPEDEEQTLKALVRGAAGFLERRTGYVILQGQYELLAPAWWTGPAEVMRTPLRSIDAIEYQGARDDWTAVDPLHYWTSPRERSFLIRLLDTFSRPALWQNEDCVRVRFTAGFDTEESTDGEQPMDPALRTCLMMLVGHYYANRELFLAGKLEQVEMTAGSLLGTLRTFW
jgi:uncharacterized phiE125 gp8 family phage protein